jgi:hypothetical protein
VRVRQRRKVRERRPALKRGATGRRRSQKQRRLVDRYAVREARDLIEPTRAKKLTLLGSPPCYPVDASLGSRAHAFRSDRPA